MGLEKYRKNKGRIDYWILFLVFGLCLFGLLMIYSASAVLSYEQYGVNNYYFNKQLVSFGIGLVGLVIASLIDYRFWQKISLPFLALAVILLIVVLFMPQVSGAQRWIHIGGFTIQPSEITKLAFIIYLAAWLAKKKDHIKDIKYSFIPFVLIVGAIGFLIMKQPDMGTMSVILATATMMFVASGASIYQIGLGVALVATSFYLLIKSAPYRMQRFLVFLNPAGEKLGAGYHINQALLAIGSGGLLGLGFGQSKQKYLYLPEPQTDSIFAIITEELGFLRAFLVIVIFIVIFIRGYKIAKNAPDNFSRNLAIGISSWIVIQFLMNIGAMLSIIPLTGIPLPFLSYGGSSLIILLVAIGILLNISKQVKN